MMNDEVCDEVKQGILKKGNVLWRTERLVKGDYIGVSVITS